MEVFIRDEEIEPPKLDVNKIFNESLNNCVLIFDKILNLKDQRIAELEKANKDLLNNLIIPKFKLRQDVYIIVDDENTGGKRVFKDLITYYEHKNNEFMYWTTYWGSHVPLGMKEKNIFTTKEEAQKKLEESNGK